MRRTRNTKKVKAFQGLKRALQDALDYEQGKNPALRVSELRGNRLRRKQPNGRDIFGELMTGVKEMAAHRKTSASASTGTKAAVKNTKRVPKRSSKSGRG